MPDPRFFEHAGPISLSELAGAVGARFDAARAEGVAIALAAPLVRADGRSVSFFSDRRYLADLAATKAAAVFVAEDFLERVPDGCVALVTREPQAAWSRAAARLHPVKRFGAGGAVHASALLGEGVVLAPGAVVGEGAAIGAGTYVGPNAVLGPGVQVGRDCVIGANASISCALIGDRVRLSAGVMIGEAGFGVAGSGSGAVDVPQLGRVILQDGVSVGAGSCIDRGAYDDTVVGENTKIDNLVQVAHNVVLGRSCVLAAHTGISGSAKVGDGVMFGGRAGLADHVTIGAGAKIAAGAGVMRDVGPGEVWGGYPAKPIRQFLRETAWIAKQSRGRDGGE